MDETDSQTPEVASPQPAPPVSPIKSSRWLKIIIIGGAVVLLLTITGSVIYLVATKKLASKEAACTQEAKQCSDGSYVSRTGPNCAFAPVPDSRA